MRSRWRSEARAAAEAYPERKLRELTQREQRAQEAVETALDAMGNFKSAKKRKKLVDMVYFRRSHKLYGAGVELEISEETAKHWNSDFLLCVWGGLRR